MTNQTPHITSEGNIFMPYDQNALPILRGIPGARWNRDLKCWAVSLAPKDRPRVVDACERLGVSMPSGFDQVALDPEVEKALARASSAGAYPYQLDGVRFLAERKEALLADDMGLGKTFQSINAIPEGGRAIVVCPATLKLNWASEVKKWRSDLTPIVCKGKMGFQIPQASEVVIINYDILPSEFTPTDKWGEMSDNVPMEWIAPLAQTILIADEAHLCKSHKATRSKRTKVLARLCKASWAMTGTPLLSRGFDLYGVVETFNMALPIFGGFKGFTRLMDASKNAWGGWEFGTPDPSVPERMRRCMLRRLKTEVLASLPPKQYQDVLVEVGSKRLLKLSEQAMERLKECEGELPPFEEFSQLRAELASDRIEAMMDLVYSFEESGEPVVVFSAHRAPIDALQGREGWKVITGSTSQAEREDAVQLFQSGALKGIALTIKAGGVGLTLTKASKMIFCDLEWNPALNAQAEDRICRIGQTASNLQYIRLVSNCPMDLHVLKLLDEKKALIASSIENTVKAIAPPAPKVPAKINQEARKAVLDAKFMFDLSKPEPNSDELAKIKAKVKELLSGSLLNEVDQYKVNLIEESGLLDRDSSVQREAWRIVEKYTSL